jgi:hypothetical protein
VPIDGAAPTVGGIAGDVRLDPALLSRSSCRHPAREMRIDRGQSTIALSRACGVTYINAHQQAVAVLHQGIGQVGCAYWPQPLRVRRACGSVVKVCVWLLHFWRRKSLPSPSSGSSLERALVLRPGLKQRAIDREVLVADQLAQAGQQHRVRKEPLGDLGVQQPILVEGKRGVSPCRVVDVQTHEPAEQQVVLQRFRITTNNRSLRTL